MEQHRDEAGGQNALFSMEVDAARLGIRAALAGMAISGALAVAKILIGWQAGSQAVIADGVESAADVLSSLAVLISLLVAARPPDEEHPYGHGRFETLTGLLLGHVLGLMGIVIAWRSMALLSSERHAPAAYAMWPLALSIVLKAFLSAYKMRTGRRIGSSAMIADAWNDTVDIFSGGVALLAVALAVLFPVQCRHADPIGGVAVGVIIVVLGFRVVRETALHLMDTMPGRGAMKAIRASAMTVAGALQVEKCFARKTGLRYHVDLHLEVDPDLTVRASHSIAEQVRNKVKADLPWVADVLVHVEPHPRGLRQNCPE
ncbi:MAG: cation diffusion facilitator family transporter [Bryobacteraceae bacterium]|jgi:cation diffusion facilitator family transporter